MITFLQVFYYVALKDSCILLNVRFGVECVKLWTIRIFLRKVPVMPEDLDLMRRILRRDQTALGDLYDRYGNAVYSLALRILRDNQRAEEIAPQRSLHRARPDVDAVGDQLLAVAGLRLQPQRTARETHVAFVGIGGDVPDVVDHASPVSFSGRLALGPCGK